MQAGEAKGTRQRCPCLGILHGMSHRIIELWAAIRELSPGAELVLGFDQDGKRHCAKVMVMRQLIVAEECDEDSLKAIELLRLRVIVILNKMRLIIEAKGVTDAADVPRAPYRDDS